VAGCHRVRSPACRQVVHHAADERLPNLRPACTRRLPLRRRGRPRHARRARALGARRSLMTDGTTTSSSSSMIACTGTGTPPSGSSSTSMSTSSCPTAASLRMSLPSSSRTHSSPSSRTMSAYRITQSVCLQNYNLELQCTSPSSRTVSSYRITQSVGCKFASLCF
jgi:hypothetical protein